MRVGPFEITRTKTSGSDLITHIPSSRSGWWPILREGFSGAWQRSILSPIEDALTHPTFWACVTLIAGDVAKNRLKLMQEGADGISTETTSGAYTVLTKPNHFQNRIQFLMYWIICKLCRGNAYSLKSRDNRNVVTSLYLLDPSRVRPLVSPTGDVYYALQEDQLSGLTAASLVVPAREIIHDTMYALYHPLVGLSPVYACGHAAVQGLTIVSNMTRLFKRGFQLGGLLVAPGQISTETANRLERYWQDNYAGEQNAGKIAVVGDALKFEKQTLMSAVDAQLIDQLRWGDEKICSAFHVPPYMVGVGAAPNYNNVEALNQQYYQQCIQILVESLELCLYEGLEVKGDLDVEMDLDGLIRMDSATKMKVTTDGVKGGIYTPNEGRKIFNRGKLTGGDTVYLQDQDHAIEWLYRRDQQPIVPPAPKPTPGPPPIDPPKPEATKDLQAESIEAISGLMLKKALALAA